MVDGVIKQTDKEQVSPRITNHEKQISPTCLNLKFHKS